MATSWKKGVRRSVFEDVGGYDAADFPLYCDDVDLSWRVRARGWRVVHVPDAVLFHDKHLAVADGRAFVAPSSLEVHWAVLARLLLAHKWGRDDVIAETLAAAEASADDNVREALAVYRERVRAGTLPATEQGADTVAEFVGGGYGPYRF